MPKDIITREESEKPQSLKTPVSKKIENKLKRIARNEMKAKNLCRHFCNEQETKRSSTHSKSKTFHLILCDEIRRNISRTIIRLNKTEETIRNSKDVVSKGCCRNMLETICYMKSPHSKFFGLYKELLQETSNEMDPNEGEIKSEDLLSKFITPNKMQQTIQKSHPCKTGKKSKVTPNNTKRKEIKRDSGVSYIEFSEMHQRRMDNGTTDPSIFSERIKSIKGRKLFEEYEYSTDKIGSHIINDEESFFN